MIRAEREIILQEFKELEMIQEERIKPQRVEQERIKQARIAILCQRNVARGVLERKINFGSEIF